MSRTQSNDPEGILTTERRTRRLRNTLIGYTAYRGAMKTGVVIIGQVSNNQDFYELGGTTVSVFIVTASKFKRHT